LEIKPTVEERILKATIDLAILKALTSQAMTGYATVGYFTKKIGITATTTMVYNSLTSMERKGWIKCVSNRRGRSYSLTEQGREIVTKLPSISEEIQRFTRILLG
jgi:DNA-binding PadR family transcriptional regulator